MIELRIILILILKKQILKNGGFNSTSLDPATDQ